MKANEYRLIEKCVEDGAQLGWDRVHKHTNSPDEQAIINQIVAAIMQEMGEWFSFDNVRW